MKQVALKGFLRKYKDVSRIIATADMDLFVALVSSLTEFCYESPKCASRIL